ncbi:hypothetical protein [Flavobacterium sp. PL12]|uniref:hypothetical protein n=1 Tax=Flavobacterium sp. PL12 TaxID=3071718 RepID=UPI00319EAD90
MKDFRLLAIRPLKGTSDKFKKNLQPQVIYKFYQDFKFVDKTNNEVLKANGNLDDNEIIVLFPKKITSAIYSSDQLNINVSAIVGQNGSGKSSLIDFYNLILYYLASNHFNTMESTDVQILNDLRFLVHFVKEYYSEIRKYQAIDHEQVLDFSINTNELDENALLEMSKTLILILENRYVWPFIPFKEASIELEFSNTLWRYSIEGVKHYDIKADNTLTTTDFIYKEFNRSVAKKIKELISNYHIEKDFNAKLRDQLNFQIFYQIEDVNYLIEKIDNKVDFPKERLFYTILLNYSLHSMNSNNLGTWVYKLFHKNDGYQTPNVINPYRSNGNIDVNSELALSTDRLVYNIIDQYRSSEQATILKKYKFKKFIFKLKKNNHYNFSELTIEYRNKEVFLDFVSQVPSPNRFSLEHNSILDYSLGYLIKKFQKISSTYMTHFYELEDLSKMDFPTQVEELEKWRAKKAKEFLLKSNSHVARKFNQTYNFLVNYEFWLSKLSFLNNWDIHKELHLTEDELKQWIKVAEEKLEFKKIGTNEILSQLFPAIFDIDIEFENGGSVMKLSDFSSGEQQYIFNINTITYHINNLKTVEPIAGTFLKKYNYVNIILDEIELYYHPEYQKRLVQDLLDEIKKLDSLGDLKNFNILFLTHSPFILSDIPNQNILRLEEGKPSTREFEQTFGANIHDLLANDFFMQGFMGEFAKNYIKELITDIDKIPDNEIVEATYIQFLEKINLIGEPIIKNSAKSFLDKKFKEVLVLTIRREELKRELLIVTKKLYNNGTN